MAKDARQGPTGKSETPAPSASRDSSSGPVIEPLEEKEAFQGGELDQDDSGEPPAEAQPAPDSGEQLRQEVEAAQQRLAEARTALAEHQDRAKLLEALVKVADEYEAAFPELETQEAGLREFQRHETKCLREILTPKVADRIPDIVKGLRDEVGQLQESVADEELALDDRRIEWAAAKAQADSAKAEHDALKKPVASIRDRLKRAESSRTEIRKAHEAGEYAAAYWLLTDPARLNESLEGQPPLHDPTKLLAEIDKAAAASASAAAAADAIGADIKAREKTLQSDQQLLAERTKSLDERIRAELRELRPPQSEAA